MDLFSVNIAYASVDSFIANVNRTIINPLIVLLFALAIVFFLWGVLQFILNGTSEEKKTSGKAHMLWGIIGITIMMAVFAIMNLLLSTFNIQGVNPEEGAVHLDEYNPQYPPGYWK